MRASFFTFILAVVFGLSGCAQEIKSVYIPYEKQQKQEQPPKESKPQVKEENTWTKKGIVKGRINSLEFDSEKKLWIYEVKGISTANGKLDFAKFYFVQKIGNLDDIIYAIIERQKAKELFLVQKANIKKAVNSKKVAKSSKPTKKTLHVKKSKDFKKRTKERKAPGMSLPQEETISLD